MPENIDLKNIQPHHKNLHSWHYAMLLSHERNEYYSQLIKDHCVGKTVLEIGTGSGLLSVLAVRHGAKQVICCEENPLLAAAALSLFQRLGVADKIQFLQKNSNKIATSEIPQVDVVLHELFGSDPFEEDFIPTLKDARRFMKPGGIFLPEKMQLIYQVVPLTELPEKLSFAGIELTEMNDILPQVHPSLRLRTKRNAKIYELPEVSVHELLERPYSFTEKNPDLVGIDAIEVTYNIVHGGKKLRAAEFEPNTPDQKVHWFPLFFNKMDPESDEMVFSVQDQNKLMVL